MDVMCVRLVLTVPVQVTKYHKLCSKAKRLLDDDNPVMSRLKNGVTEYKHTLPVVMDLRNPEMRPHHWQEVNEALGHDFGEERELPSEQCLF